MIPGDYKSFHAVQVPAYHHAVPETLIALNVGGENFMVKHSMLRRYPGTLLGSPDLNKYYVESLNCYFFDRSRYLFEYVLQFYQCGRLNLPPNLDRHAVEIELDYFKIRHNVKDNGRPGSEVPLKSQKKSASHMMENLSSLNTWSRVKQVKLRLYLFLTNPQSSYFAMLWTIMDFFLVLSSITILILESEKMFAFYFTNAAGWYYQAAISVEVCSQCFFTLDFILRLVSWPRIKKFFNNGMNMCDVISLLPFYLPQLMKLIGDKNVKSLIVLRIIRMFRITRIFRIVRHSHGLIIVFQFLFNSTQELVMLAGLFSILTLLFSSLIYYVESSEGVFVSIPVSAWWAVVTVTGIGYGDMVPETALGKGVGVVAIMTGVIFLALPMTIIITKFTKHMETHYRI